MMIEFVGLPGAGKSTIARLLTEQLERSGHTLVTKSPSATMARRHIRGRWSRIYRAAQDLLLSLGPTWSCRRLLLAIGMRPDLREFRYHYWRLMRLWLAIGRLTRSQDHPNQQLIVFDQGLLNCLPSIFPGNLKDYERSMLTRCAVRAMKRVLPDVVVLVSVDRNTAAQRLRSRPYQRTTYDIDRPDLEVLLEPRWRYTEHALVPALVPSPVRVIKLSGLDAAEANAKHIMDDLEDDLRRLQRRPRVRLLEPDQTGLSDTVKSSCRASRFV
jgi:energy-coupling factor transporter ATP-binding protein EcfA2